MAKYSNKSKGGAYERSISTDRGKFTVKGGTSPEHQAAPMKSDKTLKSGPSGSAGGYEQGTGSKG